MRAAPGIRGEGLQDYYSKLAQNARALGRLTGQFDLLESVGSLMA
jgi:hypothetical protein